MYSVFLTHIVPDLHFFFKPFPVIRRKKLSELHKCAQKHTQRARRRHPVDRVGRDKIVFAQLAPFDMDNDPSKQLPCLNGRL